MSIPANRTAGPTEAGRPVKPWPDHFITASAGPVQGFLVGTKLLIVSLIIPKIFLHPQNVALFCVN